MVRAANLRAAPRLVPSAPGWENGTEVTLTEAGGPPKKKDSREDREIDYLMCSQCGTPCYVFEMDGSRIVEATCLVCGNDEIGMFNLGEEAGPDED